MDYGEIYFNGLIDTGALSCAILETDSLKTRLLAPYTKVNEDPLPAFQIMVAIGQLETPIATIELQLEIGEFRFREKLKVMTFLTKP